LPANIAAFDNTHVAAIRSAKQSTVHISIISPDWDAVNGTYPGAHHIASNRGWRNEPTNEYADIISDV
jgi:nicotinamidase-related amidase